MVNPSKNIGTAGESLVVKYLQKHGFPNAKRRALAGALDEGDILACESLIVEVKAGHAAENASDEQLRKWCSETEHERVNAHADKAFLVVKRKGHGATKIGGWWVVQNGANFLARYRLDEYVESLLDSGWGDL